MAEDRDLCTYVRHHQQKLVLFLSAMRSYADELSGSGFQVTYHHLESSAGLTYEKKLKEALEQTGATSFEHFEIEDKPFERRLVEFAKRNGLTRRVLQSPMFTCSRETFAAFAADKSRLMMADFYKQQRRDLDVMVDADLKPHWRSMEL